MSLEVLAFVISAASFFGGIVAWYSANVQKRYAAQRDFQHLKRNYEQLSQNIDTLTRMIDDRFDRIDTNTVYMQQKMDTVLLHTASEKSTGWLRKPDSDKG